MAKTPNTSAARAVSPPVKPSTSVGSTGSISPSARQSSVTVQKMKARARRDGMLTTKEEAAGRLPRPGPYWQSTGLRT